MKKYVLVLFLLLCFSGYAQNTVNNYKYVLVPEKFSFLKQNDQYSLNSLTKALFMDKGYTVYFDNNELPADIVNNKCQALSVDILEKGGMFTTSLTILLKDCRGNIVYKSKEGKSREKDYAVAYNTALRDAFTSFDQFKYTYSGATNAPVAQVAITPVPTPPAAQIAATPPLKAAEVATNQQSGTLYAQAIANGYQLIDTTPKKVLTLLKTSDENYFIASSDTANGIVLKKNGDWFFEYYKDSKLVSEKLLVKF